MRRAALWVCAAGFALAADLPPVGAAEAAKPGAATLSSADRAAIDRVNTYLNAITHLEGDFEQIASSGQRRRGRFFLRRPWKMRFQYAPPDRMLVIADGTWLIVQEQGESGRADRYPLKSTPARFLLAPRINLAQAAKILRVRRAGGDVRLWLGAREEDVPGVVQLRFQTKPSMALTEWTVVDAQGQRTEIILSQIRHGKRAANHLFVPRERDPFNTRR